MSTITNQLHTVKHLKKVRKKCQSVDQAKKNLESINRILNSSVWLKINIFIFEILGSISKGKKKNKPSATT